MKEFSALRQLTGTSHHPIWSLDQHNWTGLGDLLLLREKTDVYNLEVHGEHVYEVTAADIPWLSDRIQGH